MVCPSDKWPYPHVHILTVSILCEYYKMNIL